MCSEALSLISPLGQLNVCVSGSVWFLVLLYICVMSPLRSYPGSKHCVASFRVPIKSLDGLQERVWYTVLHLSSQVSREVTACISLSALIYRLHKDDDDDQYLEQWRQVHLCPSLLGFNLIIKIPIQSQAGEERTEHRQGRQSFTLIHIAECCIHSLAHVMPGHQQNVPLLTATTIYLHICVN